MEIEADRQCIGPGFRNARTLEVSGEVLEGGLAAEKNVVRRSAVVPRCGAELFGDCGCVFDDRRSRIVQVPISDFKIRTSSFR